MIDASATASAMASCVSVQDSCVATKKKLKPHQHLAKLQAVSSMLAVPPAHKHRQHGTHGSAGSGVGAFTSGGSAISDISTGSGQCAPPKSRSAQAPAKPKHMLHGHSGHGSK